MKWMAGYPINKLFPESLIEEVYLFVNHCVKWLVQFVLPLTFWMTIKCNIVKLKFNDFIEKWNYHKTTI
jgi:hypothetical protein